MKGNINDFDFFGFFDGACEPRNPGGAIGMGFLAKTSPDLVSNILTLEAGQENLIYKNLKAFPASNKHSNNVAEYRALIHGLRFFTQDKFKGKKILICGDSQMCVRQLANFLPLRNTNQEQRYKIRGGLYHEYAMTAIQLIQDFEDLHLWWIPRDENEEADSLSKQALLQIGVKPVERRKKTFY